VNQVESGPQESGEAAAVEAVSGAAVEISAVEINAVEISAVTKVFEGKAGQVTALQEIDLTVAPGEFVSLIGPSGCGKSTLLRIIADLLTASEGEVRVFGKTAHQARLDQDYGIAFQQAGLLPWRTVATNVELPLQLHGMARIERKARAKELLEMVGLGDFAGHHPEQLSGGMQQRVAIARAMAERPKLLLMDEPFGALDEMTRERMQAELVRLQDETQAAVVFVTHSIPEAVFLSDRVVIMSPRPGRISGIVDVDLTTRDDDAREDERFFAAVTAVREALRAGESAGRSAGHSAGNSAGRSAGESAGRSAGESAGEQP
jgi:NitT/TauT family transport system ATP-binding protein